MILTLPLSLLGLLVVALSFTLAHVR